MIRNHYHKQNQDAEADGVGHVGDIRLDARAFDLFYKKKEKPATVECWKWDKIDDCKIDRDKCREGNEVSEAEL